MSKRLEGAGQFDSSTGSQMVPKRCKISPEWPKMAILHKNLRPLAVIRSSCTSLVRTLSN